MKPHYFFLETMSTITKVKEHPKAFKYIIIKFEYLKIKNGPEKSL